VGVVVEGRQEQASLRLFRHLAVAQFLAIAVVAALLAFRGSAHARHSGQLLVMTVLASAVLCCWVVLPALARRSGAANVPVAIALSLAPVLGGEWMLARERHPFSDYLASTGELELFLLFPLLVAAWRFGAVAVSGVAVAVAGADLLATQASYPEATAALGYDRVVLVRMIWHLAVGLIVSRLLRDQRAARRALEEANRRLAGQAAMLEELAVTRERNRLARELHDTVAHTLSGLAVQLEAVRAVREDDERRARDLTDAALVSVRRGLVETRRALADLRAGPLEEFGLPGAIARYAAEVGARSGAEVLVEVDRGWSPLPGAVEHAVYQVTKEALENAARHARPRQVRVRLRLDDGTVELTVADDGSGFDPRHSPPQDPGEVPPRLGMLGMHERARLVGGSLEVTSRPGAGTTVRLRVPGQHQALRPGQDTVDAVDAVEQVIP